MEPILLSWSGGKDSALALHRLRAAGRFEVAGLLTTVTAEYDRVSIHGVRRVLLRQQADALSLPLVEVSLSPASSNEQYESAWVVALATLPPPMREARRLAFGDIFLEDVRAYREALAHRQGFGTAFPLWGESTHNLSDEVVDAGFAATLVCVDTTMLSESFAGRSYDRDLVAALPSSVDPCGERGEFHTFVSDGPDFLDKVEFSVGETVLREERFAYCDLLPPSA